MAVPQTTISGDGKLEFESFNALKEQWTADGLLTKDKVKVRLWVGCCSLF
jgi:hypothetical protein